MLLTVNVSKSLRQVYAIIIKKLEKNILQLIAHFLYIQST